ncbi:TrkA-N domain protein [Candidatus Moduliflexus flocculans]|uniref:Trk system potassium uptake protein TrkA n=1 Tax=Candidatus Moduliflexus flocculans TaxID=1499966 RepID=A0A0S6VQY2_9BACT|nr:TrkA-N domain protein [Candidatus Moduliflexus flocculans]
MNILIVGGGEMAYFLSRSFISKGYAVTIINRHADQCTQLARKLRATVVFGDGSLPQILEDAGAYLADAVLAVTSQDQKNLVICQIAQMKFNIPQTIALVNDPENEAVFRKLGIQAISTTRILSNVIEQKTGFDEIVNLIPIEEGKINVTEVALNEDSSILGKSMSELALPENALVACIIRENSAIVPHGNTRLERHDKLIVMTVPENHGAVLRLLTNE